MKFDTGGGKHKKRPRWGAWRAMRITGGRPDILVGRNPEIARGSHLSRNRCGTPTPTRIAGCDICV